MTQTAAPTPLDRALQAFRKLVASVLPNLLYFAAWEYQVQRADGQTFDGSPTEQGLPLPPLVRVPYRCSLAGATCVPMVGCLAYVTWSNGDPSRPILVAFGPPPPASGPQQAPPSAIRIDATLVTVGDPGGSPEAVARVTDDVDGGTVTATVAAAPGPVTFIYTPPGGAPLPPSTTLTISGVITTGSTKLQSE